MLHHATNSQRSCGVGPSLLAGAIGAVVVALCACSSGKGNKAPNGFSRDLDRICHAEKHSGALDVEPGQRQAIVAQWLIQNLETKDARQFLGKLAALAPAEKVKLLQAESKKAGIGHCDLADSWNG